MNNQNDQNSVNGIDGHWYFLSRRNLIKQNSKERCEQFTGYLAYAKNELELQAIADVLPASERVHFFSEKFSPNSLALLVRVEFLLNTKVSKFYVFLAKSIHQIIDGQRYLWRSDSDRYAFDLLCTT